MDKTGTELDDMTLDEDLDLELDTSSIDDDIEVDDIFDAPESREENTIVFEKDKVESASGEEEREPLEEDLYEEEEARPRKRKKSHKALFAVILIVVLGINVAFMMSPIFTVQAVEVEGNKYYKAERILRMSGAKPGKNIFFGADKGKIKKRLMKDPVFKSVKVQRKLPWTLVIKVEEKEQLAALKYGDRFVVIDADHNVLRIADQDPRVTIVEGLTIKKMEVDEKIEVEESRAFGNMVTTLDKMNEGDIYFKKIIVSKVNVTAYIYDTLLVKGTAERLKESIESGDLQKIVNNLFKRDIKHGTVNLAGGDHITYSPKI